MMDNLHRFLTDDGAVVLSILDSTAMVREMKEKHGTSATMTAVLGQALTAASLMGYGLKDVDDTISINFKGGGPAGSITAVGDWHGNVRACCDRPGLDLPALADGNFDIARAVGGDGFFNVVKDLGMDTPYVGQVELTDGDIAKEVTRYYAISEQIPTVCSLGVIVDRDLSVARAGGYLLQLLPGCPDETIDKIEKNLADTPSLTAMLDEGRDFEYIASRLLFGLDPNELDSSSPEYRCNCSRERMEEILISLGSDELRRLAGEQDITEIVCHYCNTGYEFTSEEMCALADAAGDGKKQIE